MDRYPTLLTNLSYWTWWWTEDPLSRHMGTDEDFLKWRAVGRTAKVRRWKQTPFPLSESERVTSSRQLRGRKCESDHGDEHLLGESSPFGSGRNLWRWPDSEHNSRKRKPLNLAKLCSNSKLMKGIFVRLTQKTNKHLHHKTSPGRLQLLWEQTVSYPNESPVHQKSLMNPLS